jgi:hypothetical protein
MPQARPEVNRRWWRAMSAAMSAAVLGCAVMLAITASACAPGEHVFPPGTSVADVRAKLGRPAAELGNQPGGVEAMLALVPGQCQKQSFAGVLYYGYLHTMRHPWSGEDVLIFIDTDARVRCIAKRQRTESARTPKR